MKNAEWSNLKRALIKQGCEIKMGGKGHWKVYRDGRLITTLPHSNSDVRAWLNKRSELRKLGVAV